MSSGAQAQIAASQAASAASAEAARNALEFSKQIFATQQQQRNPYINAGTSSLGMLMNLLGLNTSLVHNGSGVGAGSGASLKQLASAGTGGGGKGGGTNPGASGTGTSAKFGPLQTFPSGLQGYVQAGNPTGNYITPNGERKMFDVPGASAGDPTKFTSGGGDTSASGTTAVSAVDPTTGQQKWIPANLAPFYQSRGFQIQ